MSIETEKDIERVAFSLTGIRAGELDEQILSIGYLAALAEATGRELISAGPEFEKRQDWSDYDYPQTEETYIWGDQSYGLKAMTSGLFVHHGRRGGSLVFWVFKGLPAGLRLQGQSKLHSRWQSFAELVIESEDQELVQRLASSFRKALEPWDVRQQPEGRGIEALEQVLTDLCWYGDDMEPEQEEILAAALPSLTSGSAVASSVNYLRAVLKMAQDETEAAAELLRELASAGRELRFSHGMNLGWTQDGKPEQVAWQDDFDPPLPWLEVLLGQAWVAEQRGNLPHAVSLYRQVVSAKASVAGRQARQQLKRFKNIHPE